MSTQKIKEHSSRAIPLAISGNPFVYPFILRFTGKFVYRIIPLHPSYSIISSKIFCSNQITKKRQAFLHLTWPSTFLTNSQHSRTHSTILASSFAQYTSFSAKLELISITRFHTAELFFASLNFAFLQFGAFWELFHRNLDWVLVVNTFEGVWLQIKVSLSLK